MPFLTFEGIDGSGKSSLLKNLAQHLKQMGKPVEITCEPGGTELGLELRQILLRTKGTPPTPEAELLIYEADRAQHVAKIRSWLEKKSWVLSDRYADSSLAFQGAGRSLHIDEVQWLNHFATRGLKPEMTVLLDCPVELSLERRKKRERDEGSKPDRFEKEKHDFHEAVRQEFLRLAKAEPKRFLVLSSEKSEGELLTELLTAIEKKGLL